jgi:alkylation response protein AidB-like acyl-CoA dehydrogenase
MDFLFSREEEQLRADVQAFIREQLTDDVKAELRHAHDGGQASDKARSFLRAIVDRGWSGVSWPKEYGGQGMSRAAQFIVEEEFWRADAIYMGGGGTGAPSILASGTKEQMHYYIPRCISREITFCQGYSEPHCGTDLAGVRCRATRDGDKYVINGQKIYTTGAHASTHIFLLVRTDPDSQRQGGLSVLLVPMDAKGITVRPLWTIQSDPPAPTLASYAHPRTNEVFFDNVEVEASCRLGEEGDGWGVAQRGLNLDRIAAFRYLISVMRDEDVVRLLREDNEFSRERRDDDSIRDKIAELWIEGQVCRLMTLRSLSISQRNLPFTYEGAAEKVFAPEHGVKSTEAISQILGPRAQLLSDSAHTLAEGVYAHNLLGAFQSTVNHGSVQVMRDQVARKGFGMPRQKISR